MLFQVEMDVQILPGLAPEMVEQLKKNRTRTRTGAAEVRPTAPSLAGRWTAHANVSIFDVESNETLHDIPSTLPLVFFMRISVTPLCRHPSSIHTDDR